MTDRQEAVTRVLLIRHGETDWNKAGRWQGHAPVPLNAAGVNQSAALGRYLAANGLYIDVLVSSDLKRAMQTAQAVAEALSLPLQTDPRLREIDLGDWQGLTREEVIAWDGERYAAYHADWHRVPAPNGESRLQVKTRARAAFDELTDRHAGKTLALVSHGGTIGMLIESLFGPIERPTLANTSITLLERRKAAAEWSLVRIAWVPHLPGTGALGETW